MVRKSASLSARTAENGFTEEPWKAWILEKWAQYLLGSRKSCGGGLLPYVYILYTGIPTDWEYPRQMLHYTSDDLWDWEFKGRIDLNSQRVIDACVYEVAPHQYKMWYKDEEKESRTYAAVSSDLYHWEVLGEEVSDCAQEGPNVFELDGIKWMISDYWHGLAVYRSEDFAHWSRCADILEKSGTRPLDRGLGHHGDVLVKDGRAFLFYFCSLCRRG